MLSLVLDLSIKSSMVLLKCLFSRRHYPELVGTWSLHCIILTSGVAIITLLY